MDKSRYQSPVSFYGTLVMCFFISGFFPLLSWGQSNSESDDDSGVSQAGLESTVLYTAIDTSGMKPEFNRYGESEPVLEGINQRLHEEPFKSEVFETVLNPRQQIEYMVEIDQGEVILYTWQVNGRVYHDFHAHQENIDPEIWVRYTEGEINGANGSLVAPYTGEHGWYWANLDNVPVRLKLTVSGYYKTIRRINL